MPSFIRRDLLQLGAAVPLLALATRLPAATTAPTTLLMLGGTDFIGPHLTEQALARGFKVTHFNRGKRDPDGVPGVETLIGDRKGDLEALRGRRFDAVIDNTGYVPKHVKRSVEILAPNVGYALFVSSISAYASFAKPNDETSPTGTLANVDEEEVTNESYGPMKALCERYTLEGFPGRASIVRPGYIVGPRDGSDRFTYWPVRTARGGEMLAPGTPRDPVQIIDVRDLAAWMLDLVAARTTGLFNAVSAPDQFTMGGLIDACRAVVGPGAATPTWVPESFLFERWKREEVDIPPWSPMTGEFAAASLNATDRARATGLRIRPLDDTVRDTLAWFRTLPPERQAALRAGIKPEIELETLEAWRAKAPKA
jgi:2'-hydroxyisoflavone reductase